MAEQPEQPDQQAEPDPAVAAEAALAEARTKADDNWAQYLRAAA